MLPRERWMRANGRRRERRGTRRERTSLMQMTWRKLSIDDTVLVSLWSPATVVLPYSSDFDSCHNSPTVILFSYRSPVTSIPSTISVLDRIPPLSSYRPTHHAFPPPPSVLRLLWLAHLTSVAESGIELRGGVPLRPPEWKRRVTVRPVSIFNRNPPSTVIRRERKRMGYGRFSIDFPIYRNPSYREWAGWRLHQAGRSWATEGDEHRPMCAQCPRTAARDACGRRPAEGRPCDGRTGPVKNDLWSLLFWQMTCTYFFKLKRWAFGADSSHNSMG